MRVRNRKAEAGPRARFKASIPLILISVSSIFFVFAIGYVFNVIYRIHSRQLKIQWVNLIDKSIVAGQEKSAST